MKTSYLTIDDVLSNGPIEVDGLLIDAYVRVVISRQNGGDMEIYQQELKGNMTVFTESCDTVDLDPRQKFKNAFWDAVEALALRRAADTAEELWTVVVDEDEAAV